MQMSTDVFYKLVDEVAAHHAAALSDEAKYVMSIYLTERRRGGDTLRTFEYTHPHEYAALAKIAVDFSPAARTMGEQQQQRLGESEYVEQYLDSLDTRTELYQHWLTIRLRDLAEAHGDR